MRGQLPWSATPSPFQPKPLNNHPRTHSCATHATAARNAVCKFRHELKKSRGVIRPMNQAQNVKLSPRQIESSNDNPRSQKFSYNTPNEPNQLNAAVKKTTPATYPSAKLRNHRRLEFRPENQTAVISGVRAIQQSQL